jgi:hypothetical protein
MNKFKSGKYTGKTFDDIINENGIDLQNIVTSNLIVYNKFKSYYIEKLEDDIYIFSEKNIKLFIDDIYVNNDEIYINKIILIINEIINNYHLCKISFDCILNKKSDILIKLINYIKLNNINIYLFPDGIMLRDCEDGSEILSIDHTCYNKYDFNLFNNKSKDEIFEITFMYDTLYKLYRDNVKKILSKLLCIRPINIIESYIL